MRVRMHVCLPACIHTDTSYKKFSVQSDQPGNIYIHNIRARAHTHTHMHIHTHMHAQVGRVPALSLENHDVTRRFIVLVY